MLSKNGIRASDDDRGAVVAMLRDAYVAGRLDLAGIRDRAGAAYAAQTWGQLQELTADLPGGSGRPSWARPGVAAAPAPGDRGWWYRSVAPTLLIMLALLAVAAAVWDPAAVIPLIILCYAAMAAAAWTALAAAPQATSAGSARRERSPG